MPIKFQNISSGSSVERPIDPVLLFQSLRVTDSAVNDLWLAQGDALREWDANRMNKDIAIVLNTGAGKTLVGLLAAQSLVNETHGRVVYVCSSIQLVRQTADKAQGYGLSATTYLESTFSNQLFNRGEAPCITTYQAVFNGKSRFFGQDIDAVIFDDAHSAGALIRDQFTLHVGRSAHADAYVGLTSLFRTHFEGLGQQVGYQETVQGRRAGESWFIPPFAIKEQLAQIHETLIRADLNSTVDTMFTWEFLRDKLDLCAAFVSGGEVTFTPPVVPVDSLRYFEGATRRLYLSATLSAKDGFVRTFGRVPDPIIAPQTTAGECERMILIPSSASIGAVTSDVDATKAVIKGRKSLVLVPSRWRSDSWIDVSTAGQGSVDVQVDRFKSAVAPACLVLVGRYDGVDLPGDICRILVVDDLPSGLNALERFLWERVGLSKLLRSTVASRVVQAFGRISRGMSDHGVVVISGPRLVEWLMVPKNRALLPPFLQRQIALGMIASEQAESLEDLVAAAGQCLDRDPDWVSFYESTMKSLDAVDQPDDDDVNLKASMSEAAFMEAFWRRDYDRAVMALEPMIDDTFEGSKQTGAWHSLWLGYAQELAGNRERSDHFYMRAYRASPNIPPPRHIVRRPKAVGDDAQIDSVAALLEVDGRVALPTDFDFRTALLEGGTEKQAEAALASLGVFLGVESSRPDNDLGTGPDVLWELEGTLAASIEAKTGKDRTFYRKADLGQLRDHKRWVLARPDQKVGEVVSAFAGPLLEAAPGTNPDNDMFVIPMEAFCDLRDRVRAALVDISSVSGTEPTASAVRRVFGERGLLWPSVFVALQTHRLTSAE